MNSVGGMVDDASESIGIMDSDLSLSDESFFLEGFNDGFRNIRSSLLGTLSSIRLVTRDCRVADVTLFHFVFRS